MNKRIAFIGILLGMAYILMRAYSTSLTTDEAATLIVAYNESLKSALFFLFPASNNHWLNTIFVHLISHYISMDELAIRLPNVLAGLLYMCGCFRILTHYLNHSFSVLPGLILLIANPYLLEYFALCRGYGLSIGFMVWAIHFLLRFSSDLRYKYLLKYFLFSLLMLMSSFVTLHFFLAATLWGFGVCVVNRKENLQRMAAYIGLSIATLSVIAYPLYLLRSRKELYWGGSSLWNDTIVSLARNIKYNNFNHPWTEHIVAIVFGAVLLITLIVSIRRSKSHSTKPNIAIAVVFGFTLLSLFLQYQILHVLYLMNRTALFIVPLFFIALIFGLDEAISVKKISPVAKATSLVLSGIFLLIFLSRIQFRYTSDWPFNAHCEDVSQLVIEESGQNNTDTLYTDHLNEYVFCYYINYKMKLPLTILPFEKWEKRNAFYFLPMAEVPPSEKMASLTIRDFDDIHYSLFRTN